MSKTPAPPSWYQAWSWWYLYAAVSFVDHGLTLRALATGRLGVTPGGPYEANHWIIWLLVQQETVLGQMCQGVAIIMGVLLLWFTRPVWPRPWVRRVTLGLLVAGIAWEAVGVISVALLLIGG